MAVPNQYNKYTSLYTVPKKPELTDVQKRLIERMQRNRCKIWLSYAAYAAADEADKKPDNYFPTKTGWGIARKRVLNGNVVEFITTATECPLVEEVQPKVVLDIHNKIPGGLLKEILANFNKVCEDSNNECAAQIYREREGDKKYFIYYPEQKVSTAQVTYTHDPQLMELAKTYDLIMELHSHDSMGAFWSGTDDSNENTCGFYMVIGRFNSSVVEYKCRAKLDKTYADFPALRSLISEIHLSKKFSPAQTLSRQMMSLTRRLQKKALLIIMVHIKLVMTCGTMVVILIKDTMTIIMVNLLRNLRDTLRKQSWLHVNA